MNEEKLNSILEEQRKEYQKHLGTLSESFESQMKLLAESVSGIQGQLTAVRDMVASNAENLEIIKAEIHFIKQALKQKVDMEEFENLEKRVMLLERKLGRV